MLRFSFVPHMTHRTVVKLTIISAACIDRLSGQECILGDAVCQNKLGAPSYCIGASSVCNGDGGAAIGCTCGDFLSPGDKYFDYDNLFVPGFPFVGDNYPNMSIIARPGTPVGPVSTSTIEPTMETTTESSSTGAPVPQGSGATTTKAPTTVTTPTTTQPTTVTTTTVAPSTAGTFVWVEWPSMSGEADWIEFYGKLIHFVSTSKMGVTKVIVRVLDPIFGSLAVTRETQHDLWTVSTSSVFYTAFLSKLPTSVSEFVVYPYLMDATNQEHWVTAMGTATPLEGVFKYCSQWNALLKNVKSHTICGGVTVDGEERRGYINELPSVPSYKTGYSVNTFGYTTGYTQVGVLSMYSEYVDDYYFEFYDFYVRDAPSLQLVQNSDVGKDNVADFIALLDNGVWAHYLPFYESPKVNFMWSVQNSGSNDCLYPDGPTTCGIKEDFGAWSLTGFMQFLAAIKAEYPTKFGNKPHGIFQFSFVPNSWY